MRSINHLKALPRTVLRRFQGQTAEANSGEASQSTQSSRVPVDVEGWLSVLQSKAQTPEGKSLSIQLASLINYYNRKFEESEKSKINWEDWKKRIQTPGLVDKIRLNTESLVQENYTKSEMREEEKKSTPSAHEQAINKELIYFKTLWNAFYEDNLNQHVDLKFIPRLTDLTSTEQIEYFPASVMEHARLTETQVLTKNAYEDTPIGTYLYQQFFWGKRFATLYYHSCNDHRGIKGTVNIMGR